MHQLDGTDRDDIVACRPRPLIPLHKRVASCGCTPEDGQSAMQTTESFQDIHGCAMTFPDCEGDIFPGYYAIQEVAHSSIRSFLLYPLVFDTML